MPYNHNFSTLDILFTKLEKKCELSVKKCEKFYSVLLNLYPKNLKILICVIFLKLQKDLFAFRSFHHN